MITRIKLMLTSPITDGIDWGFAAMLAAFVLLALSSLGAGVAIDKLEEREAVYIALLAERGCNTVRSPFRSDIRCQ